MLLNSKLMSSTRFDTPPDTSDHGDTTEYTFDEVSLEGTIKRRWAFGEASRDGCVYSIPFRYWTLSLMGAEMRTAKVSLGVGSMEHTGTVRVDASHSILMPSTKKSTTRRSYLCEEGTILILLLPPQTTLATQRMHLWISIYGSITEIPADLVRQVFCNARARV